MKFQSILAIYIVILFISCRGFPSRIYISLVKFQLAIHGRKRDSPKLFFFILVGPIIWIVFLG